MVEARKFDERFIPFGDEAELVVVSGLHSRAAMCVGYLEYVRATDPDMLEESAEDVLSSRVFWGFARFWEPGDKRCPFGSDGGVRMSKKWKFGYGLATWMFTNY